MSVLAVIGPTALYLMFSWLLSAIVASDLSDRKGYGEKPGLASGLLLSAVGAVVWLFIPPKRGSLWSRHVHLIDLVTAVAGLVMFASLFLSWYSGGSNFFNELAFYDLIVPIGAAIVYGSLHARAGAHETPGLPTVVIVWAALAFLGAIVALVTPPSGIDVEWAGYMTLLAGLVALGGAVAATRVDREALAAGAPTVAEARHVGAEAS